MGLQVNCRETEGLPPGNLWWNMRQQWAKPARGGHRGISPRNSGKSTGDSRKFWRFWEILETPGDHQKSQETLGNPWRPLETPEIPRDLWRSRKSQETAGDPRRPRETAGNPWKSQETPGDSGKSGRPRETPGDPGRPREIPGNHKKSQEIRGDPGKS